ncbi:MAG TPA: non-homologous end-joining DNA ligase [Gemmatimonadales bacterium]|nr:non-homologous end-joining DNA ligase [Gemmatimonadales bacterium]
MVTLPRDEDEVVLTRGKARVQLTNLRKVYWPERKHTKRDLLQYYLDLAPILVPHLKDRAMVMKRYPNGIHGPFFFMKRTPDPAPAWLKTCRIRHTTGVIAFPMVQDLLSLLWVVNLGCIDLNPWYSRCDDTDRPDYLHFDLDPTAGASFAKALQCALILRDALETVGMKPLVKTSGASGLHVYVAIKRGPTQKQVWTVAKTIAVELAGANPRLMTTKFKIAERPRGTVLVDYNQNAWGRTLASVYSVRPTVSASVSVPLTWKEVEKGVAIEDFRLDNIGKRLARVGDLWKPMLAARGRFDLSKVT